MLNIHDLIRLTKPANPEPTWRTIAFDGKVAISMANAFGSGKWWAGVPFTQADVKEPVAVPVDAILQHLQRSRHLFISNDHVHNNQGMRTEWKNKPNNWSMSLDAMPPRPEGLPVQFDLDLDALDRVLVAVDPDDIRPSMRGVFLDFETGRLAGTDGKRVHLYNNKVPKLTRAKDQGALQIIVPRAPAHWLLKSDDKAARVSVWRLGEEKSLVLMQTSEALVYTVAIDAKFPDVMRVMPLSNNKAGSLTLHPGAFADAVDAMRKSANKQIGKKSGMVTVHWGTSRIYAQRGPDYQVVAFERSNFLPGDVKDLYASYNPQYLADVADCVTEQAVWVVPQPVRFVKHGKNEVEPTGSQKLAVFDGDFSAVVMPLTSNVTTPPTDKPEKPIEGVSKPMAGKEPAEALKPPQAATVPQTAGKAATEPENSPKPASKGPVKATKEAKPPKTAKTAVKPAEKAPKAAPEPVPAVPAAVVVPESKTVH